MPALIMLSVSLLAPCLVFTRTKQGANKLTESMISAGIKAAAIHGNKGQGARTKALAGFKDGSLTALVATDIAARGLDIPLLPHVVNFELPNIPEDYVHRIGRTGRAGASGDAISLVSHDEEEYVRGIEKLLGHRLTSEVIPGFEQSVMSKQELEAAVQANKQQQRPPSGNRDRTKRPSNRNNNNRRRN